MLRVRPVWIIAMLVMMLLVATMLVIMMLVRATMLVVLAILVTILVMTMLVTVLMVKKDDSNVREWYGPALAAGICNPAPRR